VGLWDSILAFFGKSKPRGIHDVDGDPATGEDLSKMQTPKAAGKRARQDDSDPENDLSNMKTAMIGVVPTEALAKAEEEARERWPEFVSAFERRKKGQTFFVKAQLGQEKEREYLWIDVELLHDRNIRGKITSDPKREIGYREGDIVNVREGDICDWTYSEGKVRLGGFTISVLKRAGIEE